MKATIICHSLRVMFDPNRQSDARIVGRGRRIYHSGKNHTNGLLEPPDFRSGLRIKRQSRFTCFVMVVMSWVVILASRGAAAGPPDWIDWNGENFFESCQSDCSVSLSGGRQITTAMTRIMLIHNPVPAWEWHWGNAGIINGEFSRRLVTFWHALDIEPQIGIGKRFGDMQAVEFWGAVAFRWTAFPWNDYIKTTIAISEGVGLATQVDTVERAANANHAGSVFLNYFSPEITFSLPNFQKYELVFCIHHRSGLYGLIDNVNAGSQFGTIGFRVHF